MSDVFQSEIHQAYVDQVIAMMKSKSIKKRDYQTDPDITQYESGLPLTNSYMI